MAVYNEVKPKQTFIGKLNYDADLLEELTAVCKEKGFSLGRVEAIGAVRKARLGYYDQHERKYHFFDINKGLEITSLVGNISLRDGEPTVHAHVTLADSDGRCYGGHLASGTIVFAGEFVIQACDGPEYRRGYDEKTGLPLWEMS
jgi:predicted DNA-binding protein with PD1-like motif